MPVAFISDRTETLVGTSAIPNVRRSERRAQKLPVTVLAKSMGLEFEQPASTLNVSQKGLRILTDGPFDEARPLNPGQIVYVYGAGDTRLGFCRVVWVHTDRSEDPSEAGLEFFSL